MKNGLRPGRNRIYPERPTSGSVFVTVLETIGTVIRLLLHLFGGDDPWDDRRY